MKVVAVIQARMGSTRLPGKVLLPLGGSTVLSQVIRRVAGCDRIDRVVVATTDSPTDDPVAEEASRHGAGVFRGSEQDVLSRYYGAALQEGADVVIRVTSDCPLLDTRLLCDVVADFLRRHAAEKCDYLSNTQTRTYPRGLDIEVFTFEALRQAHEQARHAHEREHVTPYIYNPDNRFSLASYEGETDLSAHRWTLDTPEDLALLTAVVEQFAPRDPTTDEVVAFLAQHPEIRDLNAHVEQKKLTEK